MKKISSRSISMPDVLWEKVKDQAWAEKQTTSAYITAVLVKELEKKGEKSRES